MGDELSGVLRVAVDAPVAGVFDYLLPADGECVAAGLQGCRVRVPFGAGERFGVVLAWQGDVDADMALKPVLALLDDAPLLAADDVRLAEWLASYYHAPLGEVLALMLAAGLRAGEALPPLQVAGWRLCVGALPPSQVRAARQQEVLQRLAAAPGGLPQSALRGFSAVLKRLQQREWIEACVLDVTTPSLFSKPIGQVLNAEQEAARLAVEAALSQQHFATFLLHGVTGSGKTEVYLALAAAVLAQGRQVLVLVPEIALTPQLVARFSQRFALLGAEGLAVMHSAMSAGARTRAWRAAQTGQARVVLGTRSAVLMPMPHLGLIVVDEEHDPSYKQQEGWRYHARDVALVRAQQRGIAVVLGSATPSLETLHKAQAGRYVHLRLTVRAGGARLPRIGLLDVRQRPMHDGLSAPLLEKMREHLLASGQVLLFLNRRGFAPALTCHACGVAAECMHCSAPMTVHQARRRLVCHHCGAERALPRHCTACGSSDLQMAGLGTERLELALQGLFPEFPLERIDRDTTRRKGALEDKLARAHSGEARILLGTQMLAKGHDFPGVTLAAIVDGDSGLMSSDFRAPERLVQLIVQVAGRAGRADKPGEVLVQTHQPEHPLFQALLHGGFDAAAELLLREREQAHLPPYAHLAMLRAEAKDAARAQGFLARCAEFFRTTTAVQVWGPAPAPLERRAGKFRFQLLLVAAQRAPSHHVLTQFSLVQADWVEKKGVRWGLDIDPQEMG